MGKVMFRRVVIIALFFVFAFMHLVAQECEAREPIKIAAIFAKSGTAMDDNTPSFYAVAIARDEINAKGGLLGRPVEIVEIDNESTVVGSKKAALKAIELGVSAVIGAEWSSHSLAMAPVLQRAGIPMIASWSTNPRVTLIGNYIFRACFTDPFQGKVMARFAITDLKAKRAAILVNVNNDYSLGLAEFFKNDFLSAGKEIIYEGEYTDGDTDFSDILTQVKRMRPDVIFIPGYDVKVSLVAKQARSMGIKGIFLGGDGWGISCYKYGGKAVEGAYYSTHWHKEAVSVKSRIYSDEYALRYGEDIFGIMSYDAAIILFDAIERANSTNPKAIREALAATKNFEAASGRITFDENGDPLDKNAVILKLENGTAVYVKSIKP